MFQIIQLVPSSQSGIFFAWVVVEGIMLKIPITVPRLFYLNSKEPITKKFPGRRVNKILPHGRHNFNLIEVYILIFLSKLQLWSLLPPCSCESFFEVFVILLLFNFKVMIDEDQFRNESKKLAALLADPEVEVSFPYCICLVLFFVIHIYNMTGLYLLGKLHVFFFIGVKFSFTVTNY